MFLFKKIIGPFFDPLSICLAVLMVGLVILLFTRRQKLGKIFLSAGFIILVLISYSWLSNPLIQPLESKYPALLQVNKASGIKWVVVLGNGVAADHSLPPNDQLYNGSLVRLVEGLRIHRALPGSKLILSGGLGADTITEVDAMAKTAVSLGIDRNTLILDSQSRDTEDQARVIKQIVGNDRFILVTTASHMPRSVALVKKLGLDPLPAPTEHMLKKDAGPVSPAEFFPSSGNIMKIEYAIHEYLSIAWAKMRGRI
jgi:uncharacterized SAM-binding protein YcdF (DUF218 family)